MLMEPIGRPAARTADRKGLAFAALIGIGVAVRLWAIDAYGFFHPDEILQYLEQAHRLAFDYGVVPWEYRYGMRSWLLPLLLAGPMRLGEVVAPGSDLYLMLPRLAAATIAFVSVPAAYAIGARLGRLHGLAAMAAMAFWYESVAFSVHVLTEPLALACVLAAAALLSVAPRRAHGIAAGALLALALVLRFHYAPAIAVFAALSFRRNAALWRDAAIGAAAVLLGSALIDLGIGQRPFGWMAQNLRLNLIDHRAEEYGTLAPLDYAGMMLLQWGPFALPMLLLIAPVARRYPALFWMAVVNLAVHMSVGHKEYRFICLTTQSCVLLAAIGSAELISRCLDRRAASERQRTAAAALLVTAWGAASFVMALLRPMPPYAGDFASRLQVARAAGRDARLCGIAILQTPYWGVGGYSYIHREVPLYAPYRLRSAETAADFARGVPAYNAVIAPAGSTLPAAAGFRPLMCKGNGPNHLCLWARPGGCDPRAAPDLRLQTVMFRLDS